MARVDGTQLRVEIQVSPRSYLLTSELPPGSEVEAASSSAPTTYNVDSALGSEATSRNWRMCG